MGRAAPRARGLVESWRAVGCVADDGNGGGRSERGRERGAVGRRVRRDGRGGGGGAFGEDGGDGLGCHIADGAVRSVALESVRRARVVDARANRAAVAGHGASEPRIASLADVLDGAKRLEFDYGGAMVDATRQVFGGVLDVVRGHRAHRGDELIEEVYCERQRGGVGEQGWRDGASRGRGPRGN